MDDQQSLEESASNDVTLGELYDVVANGFDGQAAVVDGGFNMVGVKLDSLLDAQSSNDGVAADIGTVVLDPEQFDTLIGGVKVLTTEGFFLVVVLSILCGLTCWRILSRGWYR